MTAYVIPNLKKDPELLYTHAVVSVLSRAGIRCIFAPEFAVDSSLQPALFLPEKEGVEACDIVITIGGDGTILHAAALLFDTEKLLLGVNLGRVGFLATTEPGEIDQLARLATGDFQIEKRALLDVFINGKLADRALNEVLISKGSLAHTIEIEAFCDGVLVNDYRGDGLIVATPTGSTAYALSAGGPILDVETRSILLTPICAHSLYSPSIVFSGKRTLKLRLAAGREDNAGLVTVDGRADFSITDQDIVEVARSARTIDLVTFHPDRQFSMVDKKLKWR